MKISHNYVLVILDSCRFDSVQKVWPRLVHLPKVGNLQEAYTFATWTAPAHLNFLTGRLPWRFSTDETGLRTGGTELYDDLGLWDQRLGCEVGSILNEGFSIVPRLHELNYSLQAIVSARPLGPGSFFSTFFDSHIYVGRQGDTLLRALEHLDFTHQPVFLVLNLCETHYPYFDGSYDDRFGNRWVPSLHSQGQAACDGKVLSKPIFTKDELQQLHLRQQNAVRYVDSLLPKLFKCLPRNTFLTITADHGELFGESNQFGHGEVSNTKILQVPLIEGLRP